MLSKIQTEARESIKQGNSTNPPDKTVIRAKEQALKSRYFKDDINIDWKKEEKQNYYQHVIDTRDFLLKYNEQKNNKKEKE